VGKGVASKQLAEADESAKQARPVMIHSDPGSQMLHEPFKALQEDDEHDEAQIDNSPDLKKE